MSDIYRQVDNIYRRAQFSDDPTRNLRRARVAGAAADRYVRNITNQKSYDRAYHSGPRNTAQQVNDAIRKADHIKYSRSTYMGLNNG